MIRINKIYLDRFKNTRYGYYFVADKGLILNFNSDLEYEGYTTMYLANYKAIDKKVNNLVNELISKCLLEVED